MQEEDHKSSSVKDLEFQNDLASSVFVADQAVSLDINIVKSLKRKADFILLPMLTLAHLCKCV